MKFKNYIEVQSGIKDSADSPGTLDQVLTSTATGVAWVDPSTISAEAATLVVIECKNTSGATITKGTPVYQTGTVGATDVIEIAPADALISSGKQPAIGLLQTTLNDNGFGKVVITGEFLNFTTDPIDGVTPTTGDKVFLKSGGGLTLTKPTGAENGIQNLGLIGKVSGGSAGSITVSSIMRTNDVPNLPTGKIWVGDGNTIVSDTVFLDEPNGRMGIGTTSPGVSFQVGDGTTDTTSRFYHNDNTFTELNGYGIYMSRGSSYVRPVNDNAQNLFIGHTDNTWNNITQNANTHIFRKSANEFMRITSLGNVGIGTTSPEAKLDVAATTNAVIRLTSTGNGLGADTALGSLQFYGNDASVPGAGIKSSIVAKTEATLGDDSNLIFSTSDGTTNDVERMRITAGGNIGIGTTNPLQPFQVDAGSNIASFRSVGIGENNKELLIQTGGDRVTLDAKNADDGTATSLAFELGNSEKARLTTTGLGIGTTNPAVTLDVQGSIFTRGGLYFTPNGSTSSVPTWGMVLNAAGDLVIDDTTGPQNVIFSNAGNVGIGTTSPGAKLQVGSGTADDVARVFYSDNTYTEIHGYGIQTNRGTAYFRPTSDKTQTLNIGNDGVTWNTINYNSNTHKFTNDLNEWLRIDSVGNVGIGTNSPGTKLEIAGGDPLLELNTTSATGNPYMMWSQAGTRRSYIQHVDSGDNLTIASEYGGMVFMTGASGAEVERMRITQVGNVGIDTTSPNGDLGIGSVSTTAIPRSIFLSSKSSGDSGGQSSLYLATSTGGIGEIGFGRSQFASQNLAGFIKYTDATDTFVFRTNFGDRMYLNGSGNLGVGVSSPSARIHAVYSGIAGKFVSSQSTGLEVQGGGNGQPIARFKDTSASEKVTIASTGSVGIGDTSPSTKLSVNGGVQIADEPAAASAALVGTLRYRSTANTSFVDMCMQTGSTTYTWVNIVSNFW